MYTQNKNKNYYLGLIGGYRKRINHYTGMIKLFRYQLTQPVHVDVLYEDTEFYMESIREERGKIRYANNMLRLLCRKR